MGDAVARFREIDPEKASPEQKSLIEEMRSGPRQRLTPPLHVWLQSPGMAAPAHRLGEFARFRTTLGKRRSEIAILVSARSWRAQFEWWAHERLAREAGVEEAVIRAIHEGRQPPLTDPADVAVHDFSIAMLTNGRADDALFGRAKAALGEAGIVDLIGLLGYYAMVSMTLNAFEVPVPDGKLPFKE